MQLLTGFKHDGEFFEAGTVSKKLPKEVRAAAKEAGILGVPKVSSPDQIEKLQAYITELEERLEAVETPEEPAKKPAASKPKE